MYFIDRKLENYSAGMERKYRILLETLDLTIVFILTAPPRCLICPHVHLSVCPHVFLSVCLCAWVSSGCK